MAKKIPRALQRHAGNSETQRRLCAWREDTWRGGSLRFCRGTNYSRAHQPILETDEQIPLDIGQPSWKQSTRLEMQCCCRHSGWCAGSPSAQSGRLFFRPCRPSSINQKSIKNYVWWSTVNRWRSTLFLTDGFWSADNVSLGHIWARGRLCWIQHLPLCRLSVVEDGGLLYAHKTKLLGRHTLNKI